MNYSTAFTGSPTALLRTHAAGGQATACGRIIQRNASGELVTFLRGIHFAHHFLAQQHASATMPFLSPSPLLALPALCRDEYITEEGIAIICRWKADPRHPEHLVRLAHIYEEDDNPSSKLELAEMVELASIFKEAAAAYKHQGLHNVSPFLTTEATLLDGIVAERMVQRHRFDQLSREHKREDESNGICNVMHEPSNK